MTTIIILIVPREIRVPRAFEIRTYTYTMETGTPLPSVISS